MTQCCWLYHLRSCKGLVLAARLCTFSIAGNIVLLIQSKKSCSSPDMGNIATAFMLACQHVRVQGLLLKVRHSHGRGGRCRAIACVTDDFKRSTWVSTVSVTLQAI